ncbi:cytochrome ubiquinol oxidase subunit I [Capsulimonas corticalis]|uniref:Cytochrome ubiquinol oxidase subunit I n=1 Tax=Capsulimonas corticalis TaxID=2219043 RepID=A0A402D1I1_9BACT|nr:cytochrome ubiquinol oxidase subunit I [Capsulimonas corticalis]BDI28614.1 cytochrome ubiquinol oxidase subunit I [Capsulimonas corticalis]
MDALAWHRFQFGFTITYHYLFPQLTMGLALLILVFKIIAMKRNDSQYQDVARFWARIFGINFVVGVVTGIPMEFQFGTNWSRFSDFSGGVIGITLAMEGMFAFFAESAFLGLFLFGEKKLSPRMHLLAAFMVFFGSWLSGYFIIVTNAFMQHPVGYSVTPSGRLQLAEFWVYLLNPWAIWQYLHNMSAAVVTGAFVVAAVGAFWTLQGKFPETARICLKVGVIAGLIASLVQVFPTGDMHGKMMAQYQKPALAAMEGKFDSGDKAELAIIGQPDVNARKLINPIVVPGILSYLAYGSFGANVTGLNDIPKDQQPDNIELLYYAYHIMVGLGTIFIAIMGLSALLLWRGRLEKTRAMMWILMLAFPFPYIATTAGWMVAELGRQPWLIYGLQRTMHGTSPTVVAGNVAFTTLGFMGLYLGMGILFLYLIGKELAKGPQPQQGADLTGAGGRVPVEVK